MSNVVNIDYEYKNHMTLCQINEYVLLYTNQIKKDQGV